MQDLHVGATSYFAGGGIPNNNFANPLAGASKEPEEEEFKVPDPPEKGFGIMAEEEVGVPDPPEKG